MSERKTGVVAGGCGLLLAIVGVGVFISWLAGSGGNQSEAPDIRTERKPEATAKEAPSPPKHDNGQDAFYVGRKACENALKAPSTAKFSNPYSDADTGWSPYGFNQWKAFGHVDSQNSFGAMLRSQWLAVVKLSGDNYEVLYLRVGEDETGPMPAIAAALGRPASSEELAAIAATNLNKKAEADANALRYNRELAAKGDAYGQFRMGQRYLKGDGVERDVTKAREMFQKAAAQGHSGASAELAKLPAE